MPGVAADVVADPAADSPGDVSLGAKMSLRRVPAARGGAWTTRSAASCNDDLHNPVNNPKISHTY